MQSLVQKKPKSHHLVQHKAAAKVADAEEAEETEAPEGLPEAPMNTALACATCAQASL